MGGVDSAPLTFRFCISCGAPMQTSAVNGVARRTCTGCGRVQYPDPKVAVGVATFRDGRLLLVQRRMEPGRGRWSLPGGFVDAGEDPRAAAARECREEAGVEVDVGAVVDVFANPPDEGGALFVLYDAVWTSGEPVAGDECDDAAFFDRGGLPPLVFTSTEAAVARWPT